MDATEEALLEQLVDFPTHIRGNCLDLVLTNMPERILELSDAGRLGSSDHVMLCLTVAMQVKDFKQDRPRLNWRKADWGAMRHGLAATDWNTALHGRSVHDMWALFRKEVESEVKKNVPVRKERKGGRAAWMTREIMAAVRRKKRLWRKAKRGACMEEYCDADKEVKKLIRNAKRKFEKRLADDKSGNSRPFYSYVKKKTKTRTAIGPLLDSEKKSITGEKEMADLLNRFFSSVFTTEDLTSIPTAT
jgi:hypothetical protein